MKSEKLEQLNAELEDPAVWNDPKKAQDMGREKKALEAIVDTLTKAKSDLADMAELFEMGKEENDDDTLESVIGDTAEIAKVIEGLEFRRMFNNPMDPNNCFIDIQAGAGGTEAQDWASMLLRQYLRYCERKGFKAEVMEISEGEVAGIKTATIKVGISSDKAREINKLIKEKGPKGVGSQTQGDSVRVTAKKRDDLQSVIALLKGADIGVPLQFNNFRD